MSAIESKSILKGQVNVISCSEAPNKNGMNSFPVSFAERFESSSGTPFVFQ